MHDWHDHPHHDRRWQKMEQMFRRWGNFPGVNSFDWSGLEGNLRMGRMLASGDLRLIALYLIEQQPRHGYDLIKAIEEKTGGFYSPSPGVVYPALTYLEEAGYVTSSADGNKKLYTITDEGRAHLSDNRAAAESTLNFLGAVSRRWTEFRDKFAEAGQPFRGPGPGPGGPFGPGPGGPFSPGPAPDRDIPNVDPAVNDARRDLKAAIAEVLRDSEVDQNRLAEILRRAAEKIRKLSRDRRDDDHVDL
jgi:DNA-binding PadR family transcriptional regulator